MSCHQYLSAAIRERGLRMTCQRRMVLEVIHQCREPATAAEILRLVRFSNPRAESTTVYRTLKFLESFGLISAYDSRSGSRRYQHAGDDGVPHLACRQCGRTAEIAQAEFMRVLQRAGKTSGYDVHLSSIVIPGICPACQKIPKKSRS